MSVDDEMAALLDSARDALTVDDRAGALRSLIRAWHAVKHPRIANVIDFVSDELAAKSPIKGKTLKARVEAWHAIEKARDPATLGSLLALLWPGTWKPALALLTPLREWEDPRVAMALARVVEACPFDTWTSATFYLPALHTLEALRDVRTLPLLRRATGLKRSRYYRSSTLPSLLATISTLEHCYPDDAPPALGPATAAALATVEAHYRDRIDAATETSAGEVDHLAAILAHPDDLAARAVYADWLGERSDPRGEFITLQLARSADHSPERSATSDAARAREVKLLAEHADAWSGSIAQYFTKHTGVFEDGFFVGGALEWLHSHGPGFTVDTMLRDPAWALVRVLEAWDDSLLPKLVDRPELRSLRRVACGYAYAVQLVRDGVTRPWTSLQWRTNWSTQEPPPVEAMDRLDAFPQLTELGFSTDHVVDGHVAMLESAQVIERVSRVVLGNFEPRYIAALARRAGAVREIEFAVGRRDERSHGFAVWLQRDAAPGPFTRLVLRPRSASHHPSTLPYYLNQLPTAGVRELVITSPKKLAMPKAERASLVAALARFDALERRDIPWPDLFEPAKVTVPVVDPDAPTYELGVHGPTLLAVDTAEALWQLLDGDLRLGLDAYQVSTWRPLGPKPVERIRTWAKNKHCRYFVLLRDGAPGSASLWRDPSGHPTSTSIRVPAVDHPPDAIAAAFTKLVELAPFTRGGVTATRIERELANACDLRELEFRLEPSWLVFVGEPYRAMLPTSGVIALADRPALAGLAVQACTHGLLIRVAPRPEDLTAARFAALGDGLYDVLATNRIAHFGFRLADHVLPAFADFAARYGMQHVPDPRRQFTVKFASPDGSRELIAWMLHPLHDSHLRVDLLVPAGQPATRYTVEAKAITHENISATLRECAAEMQRAGASAVGLAT